MVESWGIWSTSRRGAADRLRLRRDDDRRGGDRGHRRRGGRGVSASLRLRAPIGANALLRSPRVELAGLAGRRPTELDVRAERPGPSALGPALHSTYNVTYEDVRKEAEE